MKNPDNVKSKEELKSAIQTALVAGDDNALADAMLDLGTQIQANILTEAHSMTAEALNDRTALAARGVVPLTTAETKYYSAVISGNMDGNAFDGAETLPPPTIINRVFEYLRENRELLRHINFQTATASTEWILRKGDVQLAFWGSLSSKIKELNDKGFTKERMNMYKLSCYLPVSKSMLELGPEWLDRYVREVLAEAMAYGLEEAIVGGDGKTMPIGMIRKVTDGNHPKKTATKITDLEPVTLGTEIMSPLTREGKRAVQGAILVVNPIDYWEKIFGATTYLNALGQYVPNVLPIPATFIQSTSMPKGYMCAGMARDYFMGVGFQGGIGFSDEHRYIEDERVYLTKLAANGRPLNDDSFLLFDISSLEPTLRRGNSPPNQESQETA